ncbi:nucleotide exchange factor GrpE [Erythrobacter arachoides]|uniref:Protein GrpE n=1 Tax=Aurantiacibacter arachoides TaxID=1850444 RepID=A0A845A6K8_9SPHN|nr:nucleotide exchange factor GrpE [Aurantiacibacter arachoides]MXO93179.1 nucleotide exchange factor GrpE [Aurantiacibacter arachoides]GGD51404.1 protein GrpE [Aurantiacibacter arachoides]
MTDNETAENGQDMDVDRDAEVARELDGVPEEFLSDADDDDDESVEDALASLRADLETARQETLYAKAEAQNQRRRMERDVQDARNYAATGFARDVLSVADNLARAIDAVPVELREDDKFRGLVAGIEATQRELEKVFAQQGITRIAAMGLPLDPNQHQAMLELPSNDVEPGTIVQEMQAGYMIRDRLLRPSMVGVARKPD